MENIKRPYCTCDNQCECMGCRIEQSLLNPDSLEEMIVSYFYGKEGLEFYRSQMSDYLFLMRDK